MNVRQILLRKLQQKLQQKSRLNLLAVVNSVRIMFCQQWLEIIAVKIVLIGSSMFDKNPSLMHAGKFLRNTLTYAVRVILIIVQEEVHVVMEILATVGALPANVVRNTVGAERPLPIVPTQHLSKEEARVVMEVAAMVGALPANAVLSGDGVERLWIIATKLHRRPLT